MHANSLIQSEDITGAELIGEVYPDRIKTAYSDNNELTFRFLLTHNAYLNLINGVPASESAKKTFKFLKDKYPSRVSLVELSNFNNLYDGLLIKDEETLNREQSDLCEEQSLEMARYSYALAQAESANIVLMSFGALHTHGVIEYLQKQSASYIVLSPNF